MTPTRLLIVHPEPDALAMLGAMLRSLTLEILEAGDHGTAVGMLERQPGLVLIGINPDDADALKLLSYTRHKFPRLPILLLSSADRPGVSRQALRMGAKAVLKYPLPATQLRASVLQALGLHEAPRRTGGVDHQAAGSTDGTLPGPETPPEDAPQPDRPADATPCTCTRHTRPVDEGVPNVVVIPAGMPIRPLKEALEGPEREIILHALKACGGSRHEAAKALGIHRTTLYKKMKGFGLVDE
jgi:two-component system response regulator HydG